MRFSRAFILDTAKQAMQPTGDEQLDRLYDAYNEAPPERAVLDLPNYYRFLYRFAQHMPGLKFVELGCKYGVASLHWLCGGGGRTLGIDCGEHFKRDLFRPELPINFLVARSTSAEAINLGERLRPDIVMIDTDHSHGTTHQEFYAWKEIVAPDGLILFDDIGEQGGFGCGKFFRELPKEKTLEIPELHEGGWGFGVYFMEDEK